jgi:predicted nucleic acid-binding protein
VKYFFDTSVLVAAALVQHAHHRPSLAAYLKADLRNGCCAAYSFAELYATVTRLPGNQRMAGDQALLFLDELRGRLTTIALDAHDSYSAVVSAATEGVLGGTIYHMLLAQCALKARAEIIYTWDIGDFARLGKDIARRVQSP